MTGGLGSSWGVEGLEPSSDLCSSTVSASFESSCDMGGFGSSCWVEDFASCDLGSEAGLVSLFGLVSSLETAVFVGVDFGSDFTLVAAGRSFSAGFVDASDFTGGAFGFSWSNLDGGSLLIGFPGYACSRKTQIQWIFSKFRC